MTLSRRPLYHRVVAIDPGLCSHCAHHRAVGEGRFLLCTRSQSDPRYPRYPRLPVLQCEGYEAREEPPSHAAEASKRDA